MPSVDFNELRVIVPVIDLLAHLRWDSSYREPAGLRGYCPIHSYDAHRSRSFWLLPSGLWWCHICHTGGDALSLWLKLHPGSPHTAAHDLCAALGRKVPYKKRERRPRK